MKKSRTEAECLNKHEERKDERARVRERERERESVLMREEGETVFFFFSLKHMVGNPMMKM
jgi:hypothetical protein